MKKNLLALSLCVMTGYATPAQIIIADDFDSYIAGSQLAATSPNWITWTGAPSEDALVSSAQSSSSPNSVYVIGNNGPTDLVLQFPANYTSGVYELAFKILMVANKGGYFNMQGNTVPGIDWMLETYFDNVGGGYIHAGGPNAASFTYNINQWNNIKVKVDLTGDEAEFYINNILIYTWPWSLASDGNGAPVSWGGMNLYAAAATPGDAEYYVDDVVFSNIPPTGIKENIAFTDLQVFPNPAKENFEITYNSDKSESAVVQILNPVGEVVYEKQQYLATGENRIHIMNTALSQGIYFLQVLTDKKAVAGKFIVKK